MAKKRAEKQIYHLADGWVLSIGMRHKRLLHINGTHERELGFDSLQLYEKLSLGLSTDEDQDFLAPLLAEGVAIEGPPKPDLLLQDKLAALDEPFLDRTRQKWDDKTSRAYELVLACHASRKQFYEQLGQCPVLPETALRRALCLGDAQKVGPKAVLCLGDDDLVSVALAAMGHKVRVLDVDNYVLTLLTQFAKEHDLDITAAQCDLRDPISQEEHERYDAFLTDPMSNRNCLELFLSRAFYMLKPEGVGFTALFGPVNRIFDEVREEMSFTIEKWMRAHNRYYSHQFKLHHYRSDWIKLSKQALTTPKYEATTFALPGNLYREDHYQGLPHFLMWIEEIEDEKWTCPYHLHDLLDSFENLVGWTISDRVEHLGQDWTMLHCSHREGYFNIHANRQRRDLKLEIYPGAAEYRSLLMSLLLTAYKSKRGLVQSTHRRTGFYTHMK
jgi:hypothetical protein